MKDLLKPEVAVYIASDRSVGADNFLNFVLDKEVVRIDVSRSESDSDPEEA